MGFKNKIERAKVFFTENILHTPERELTGLWRNIRRLVSVIRITAKHFLDDELQLRASALTYNTLLAIVPILALLIAIAGGFGFEKIPRSHQQLWYRCRALGLCLCSLRGDEQDAHAAHQA